MSSDIRRSNDAQLEMAIANFFHSENIAERLVESTRFKYVEAGMTGGGVSFGQQKGRELEVRYF